MATVIKAGNVASGAQVTSDATGILQFNTGSGAGTTAMTIGTDQSVTFAGAVSSSGNQTVTGNLTVNGNTTLGDANTDTILMTAAPSIGGAGLGMGFGFRNRIINGAMVIDQRNAGASVTITTAGSYTYTIDRWAVYPTQASKLTVQRNAGSVTPPAGFSNYFGATVAAAANVTVGSTDLFLIRQAIEGFNITDLGWGAAGASSITLSFWVRSSLTGVFGGSLSSNSASLSYPFTYTISSANTWELKTVTIPGPTTGGTAAWPTDNGIGIRVFFSLGTGSSFLGTAGSWVANDFFSATGSTNLISTNSATWYITGVQLEKGSTATSFDYRPYGTELALCQRYCYAIFASESSSDTYTRFGMGDCDLTTRVQTITWFPVSMRSIPSLTATAANTFTAYSAGNTFTLTAINVAPTITPKVGTTDGTTSGLTAGRAGQIIANNNRTAYLIYSAEL